MGRRGARRELPAPRRPTRDRRRLVRDHQRRVERDAGAVPGGERGATQRDGGSRSGGVGPARRRSSVDPCAALARLVAVLAVAALIAGSLTVVANEPEQLGHRVRPGSRRRASSRRPPSRTWTSTPSSASCSRSRPSRPRARRTAPALPEAEDALHRAVMASRLELEVPGLGGLLAWSPTRGLRDRGPRGLGHDRHQGLGDGRACPLVPGTRWGRERRRLQPGRIDARLHRRGRRS